MRRSSLLLAAGAMAYLAAALSARAPAAAAPESSYVGSEACRNCHEPEYTTWRQNLHVQMTKPITEAHVEGDFRPGTELKEKNRAYTMTRTRDGRYIISVAKNGRPAEAFTVDYTLGARRFQG